MTTELDRICKQHTAFVDFNDLIASTGTHYSPTMDVSQPDLLTLADAFDAKSEELSKAVRTFRYRSGKK